MPDDTTHDIKVVPPLLRKEVKRLKTSDGDFVHDYMVNSGARISADDFDISRLISFADTFKPNNGFRQWANCRRRHPYGRGFRRRYPWRHR